jgi:hypothetical protein
MGNSLFADTLWVALAGTPRLGLVRHPRSRFGNFAMLAAMRRACRG